MASAGCKSDNIEASEPEVAWSFSLSPSQYLRDPEHGGTHYARWVAGAPGIAMIMIVAAVVGLLLCVVQPRRLVIQGDLNATRFDITAPVDGRVETHPALCGDDVTAN
jgi:hypothetical protein